MFLAIVISKIELLNENKHEDFIQLSDIEDFKIENLIGKTGKKFTKAYIKLKQLDNFFRINLIRNPKYKIIFEVKCKNCDIVICKRELSKIIKLYNPIEKDENYVVEQGTQFCKICATRINGTKGQKIQQKLCQKKYGVSHLFKTKGYHERATKTKIKKYGENFNEIISKKMWYNFYLRTGYNHNSHIPGVREKMVAKWKKTVAEWTPEEKAEYIQKRLESTGDKLFGVDNNLKAVSNIGTQFLDELEVGLGFKIIREYNIKNKRLNGFIPNICGIEFNGDYWHANPEIYKEGDLITYPGGCFLADEIWLKDEIRFKIIREEFDLPILICWEKDFKSDQKKTIENLIIQIKELKDE